MRLLIAFALGCGLFGWAFGCGGRQEGSNERGCTYDGQSLQDGASFPSSDGCNQCACHDGEVACTTKGCAVSCDDLSEQHAAAVEAAKVCDPNAEDTCTELITDGPCSCGTFANRTQIQALAHAASLLVSYDDSGCGEGILCEPCLAPRRGRCSPQGRCEDDFQEGVACKVGGVVHPSGTQGIKDPFSCNSCSCNDGELSCTEAGCETPCPDGTAPGTSCAECGPTDACLVVEHACLPTCTTDCDGGGVCLDGVCRNACG